MNKVKGSLALVASLALAGATLPAASADTSAEVAASAASVAFQNRIQQIDFAIKINWATGSADKVLASSDSNKLGSDGLYYTRSVGNFSGGMTYPGYYEMHLGDKKTNTQTGNLQINVSQNMVRIFVYSADGKLLVGYSDTKTMSTYKDGQKYTVTIPQSVQNDMLKKAGIQIKSLEITPKMSTYQGKTDTICWTPDAATANNVDLTNSVGVANIGGTLVMPYALVNKDSNGLDSFAVTSYVKKKSQFAADSSSYVSGPVLKRIANGGGHSAYYFGDENPKQIHGNYDSSGQGGIEFYSQSAARNSITLVSKNSAGSVQVQAPTAKASALGTFDIGCNLHSDYPARALAQFNSSGKLNNPTYPIFRDVYPTNQFYTEISWLARTGITTGYSDVTYRPLNGTERGAIAAFFYRMAASPSYTPPKTSPFKDVPTTHQFYKEISWMASQGITTGWSDGTFRPNETVNRDAMAAFFYRFAGKPAYNAPSKSAFIDINTGNQFYKEISWVASKKISTGWSVSGGAEYRPLQPINRDAIAAFIYRYNSNVSAVPKK